MRIISLGVILLFMTSAFASDATTRKCPKGEAMEAEKQAGSLKDWDQVYRSYKRFSQCDDGAIAEGYSESITKLLAEDWKSSNRLLVLTNRSRLLGASCCNISTKPSLETGLRALRIMPDPSAQP